MKVECPRLKKIRYSSDKKKKSLMVTRMAQTMREVTILMMSKPTFV